MDEGSRARTADPAAVAFEDHRAALLGAAYRIVGTRAEAEDVLQDAWLRWQAADTDAVDNPRAYLFRLVSNLAIDHVRQAQARREDYTGPWLPEPLATGPDPAGDTELAESLSLGLLLVLQTLAPAERVVFVLHEAFGFPYDEVASMLGRTEHAIRQLAYRARSHVHARRPRRQPAPGEHVRVVRRFMDAALGGDMVALLEVLAPDVTMWADADGRSEMPRQPLHGADAVASYLVSVAGFWPADRQLEDLSVNHGPGVLVRSGDPLAPFLALAFEPDADGRLGAIYVIRNPDKLTGLPEPVLDARRLR